MLEFFRKRLDKDERGFTLIELMVVVLIIAILIAIAIPTFLGLRRRAQDRAAQSNLRNGLTAAKAFSTDNNGSYVGFTDTAGEAIEPSIDFVNGAAVAVGQVGIDPAATATQVQMVALSASGSWFCIRDDNTAGTTFGSGASAVAAQTACGGARW